MTTDKRAKLTEQFYLYDHYEPYVITCPVCREPFNASESYHRDKTIKNNYVLCPTGHNVPLPQDCPLYKPRLDIPNVWVLLRKLGIREGSGKEKIGIGTPGDCVVFTDCKTYEWEHYDECRWYDVGGEYFTPARDVLVPTNVICIVDKRIFLEVVEKLFDELDKHAATQAAAGSICDKCGQKIKRKSKSFTFMQLINMLEEAKKNRQP